MTLNKQEIVKLHKKGMANNAIAKLYGVTSTAIRYWLKKAGIKSKKTPGRKEELLVEKLLKKNGNEVVKMPSQHPFDFLVNGVRIDVKSARTGINNKRWGDKSYSFQLQSMKSHKKEKDLSQSCDYLYLLFKNTGEVWSLSSETVGTMKSLRIAYDITTSKYYPELKYIGKVL